MPILTTDKDSTGSSTELPTEPQDSKLHTGPVARLLSQVSRWAGDYAEYQLEKCAWRRLSI